MFYTIIIPLRFCFIPVCSQENENEKKKKNNAQRKDRYDLQKLNDIFLCVRLLWV